MKHLSPLRNSFSPDRRQRRQEGPVYLPMGLELHSPSFWRAAPVVGNGSYIPDTRHEKPCALERPNRCFSSRSWAFYQNIYLPKTRVHPLSGDLLSSTLGGECGPFAGAFKTHSSSAGGSNHIPLRISEAHQRIIESGVDIRPPLGHRPALAAPRPGSSHK